MPQKMQELALAKTLPQPATRSTIEKRAKKLSRTDRARAYFKRKGYSPEEIAIKTGGSLVQVQASLERYELARMEASNDEVDMAINDLVLKSLDATGKVFSDAMKAKVVVYTRSKGGRNYKTDSPDHATRLRAVDSIKGLMEVVRPKGPGIAIQNNNQFGGGGAAAPVDGARGMSFEDRIRRRRQQRAEEGTVEEAEVLEVQSVEEELSEIGIDIEDGEDDDDDLSEE